MFSFAFEARSCCKEYIQWLQFTAGGVRDALSLECAYGRLALYGRLTETVIKLLDSGRKPEVPMILSRLDEVLQGRRVEFGLLRHFAAKLSLPVYQERMGLLLARLRSSTV